jgi:hypothetical protein
MTPTDYREFRPEDAAAARAAMHEGRPVHIWLTGQPHPVLLMPVEAKDDGLLVYLATKGACVAVTSSTAFNHFELVRGGFRLDIAARLIVLLGALATGVNSVTDTQAKGLLSAPEKTGD